MVFETFEKAHAYARLCIYRTLEYYVVFCISDNATHDNQEKKVLRMIVNSDRLRRRILAAQYTTIHSTRIRLAYAAERL